MHQLKQIEEIALPCWDGVPRLNSLSPIYFLNPSSQKLWKEAQTLVLGIRAHHGLICASGGQRKDYRGSVTEVFLGREEQTVKPSTCVTVGSFTT